ncbi:hypothetical protein J6590_017053 [Homalodisca vitripennis]|nr:hypothetical protein J6590_017053 [Homalodisca vitripennis]
MLVVLVFEDLGSKKKLVCIEYKPTSSEILHPLEDPNIFLNGEEEELPPPPSPPQLKDVPELDGGLRTSSERILAEPVPPPTVNHVHVPANTKVSGLVQNLS